MQSGAQSAWDLEEEEVQVAHGQRASEPTPQREITQCHLAITTADLFRPHGVKGEMSERACVSGGIGSVLGKTLHCRL